MAIEDEIINIEDLQIATEIKSGDKILLETSGGTKLIDYKDFIIGVENITFYDLLTGSLAAVTVSSEETGETSVIDVSALSARVDTLSADFEEHKHVYEFVLKKDADGFADDSWEEIIQKGQAIQYNFWKAAEDRLRPLYPNFPEGWHGTAAMPIIKILCEEGEYFFKNTARLPGRFQVSSTRRWASILRMQQDDHDGTKILFDNEIYRSSLTGAAIGLYIEPWTKVVDGDNEMVVKPFEQTVDNIIIVPHSGVLPVYIAGDADRLLIERVKVMGTSGAGFGIKHGPSLSVANYPFPATIVTKEDGTANENVYLREANFRDIQIEGPYKSNKSAAEQRPQAAMYLTGTNITISNLTLYYWIQGPYLFNCRNTLINGITMSYENVNSNVMVPYTYVYIKPSSITLSDEQYETNIKRGIGPVAMELGNEGIVVKYNSSVNDTYGSSYVIDDLGLGYHNKGEIYDG